MALKKSTILPEPLKLLHFFTLNLAVFSALNLWHSRGQRFDPAYLHQSNIIRTFSPSGTGSDLLFTWTISARKESGPCRYDGGRKIMYYCVSCWRFHSSNAACPSSLAKYECICGSRHRASVSITKSGTTICPSSVLFGSAVVTVATSFTRFSR